MNHWKCPGCGAVHEKTDQQKVLSEAHRAQSKLVLVGGDSTTRCPRCQASVALADLASGRLDAPPPAKGATSWKCPHCGAVKVKKETLLLDVDAGLYQYSSFRAYNDRPGGWTKCQKCNKNTDMDEVRAGKHDAPDAAGGCLLWFLLPLGWAFVHALGRA